MNVKVLQILAELGDVDANGPKDGFYTTNDELQERAQLGAQYYREVQIEFVPRRTAGLTHSPEAHIRDTAFVFQDPPLRMSHARVSHSRPRRQVQPSCESQRGRIGSDAAAIRNVRTIRIDHRNAT